MADRARWFRAHRVPVACALLGIAWMSFLLAAGVEISVWADLRRDVMLRDGCPTEQINDIRFRDSSPYSVWLPSDVFVWDSIRQGDLPLWDRNQAGGYSPVLNLQNGVLHPIRWAVAVFPRPYAPSAIIVGSLVLCCVGTFLMLSCVFEISEGASLLGALTVVFSGFVVSTTLFSGFLVPIIHAPWLVWAFFRWSERRSAGSAMLLAVVVALLILAGHPLIIVVAMVVSGLLIAWRMIALGRGRDLLWGGVIVVCGILATSVVTLPMMLNLANLWSYKNSTPQGVAYVPLDNIRGFDALISTVRYDPYPTDYLDGGSLVFHMGLVTVVLLFVGLIAAAKNKADRIIPVLVVGGWILSTPTREMSDLAAQTPIGYFKPWYLMFVFVLPAVIAVAIGFDRVLEIVRPPLRWVVTTIAVVAVVVPCLRPAFDVLRAHPVAEIASPALSFLDRDDDPFRVVGLSGQTQAPNAASVTGVEDARFSSPVHDARFHEWIGLAAPESRAEFPTSTIIHNASSPLFRAFNVKYVLRSRVPGHDVQTFLPRRGRTTPREYGLDPPPDPSSFAPVLEKGAVAIYEARSGLHPRAHLAGEVVAVQGGMSDAVKAVMMLPGDADDEVVEVPDASVLTGVTPAGPEDQVDLRYSGTRRVSIETRSSGPRLLVLHDSFDRGWRAELDGRTTEIYPVSLISRGVVVPEGKHVVEMTFLPFGTKAGLAISILAAVLCPLLSSRARRSLERT